MAGAFLTPARAAAPTYDYAAVAKRAVEAHIFPGYATLQQSFEALETATAACAQDADFSYARLKPAFRKAITAWGRVAHITFGPIASKNRYERVFFWLDRKGIARRQVMRAMKNTPALYTDAATLRRASIGVQGLSAFERVMMGDGLANAPAFRCAYARAIAGNLVGIARRASEAWQPQGVWRKLWLKPGGTNARFLNPSEPILTLFRAVMTHTERVRDVELMRPLGFARRNRKLPGPFALSDLTMAFIAARLAGLRSALLDSGLVEEAIRSARALNAPQAVEDMIETRHELNYLAERAAENAKTARFFDGERRQEAISLGFPLRVVRTRSERAMAAVTDLPLGFNAADGD
ncbi:MAG: imelysin family protein [Pseudomonadota bacterium]